MAIPKKVLDRMAAGLKRLVPIVGQQRARDVSEADTVSLVKHILDEVFGFDKWAELTGEFAIKGTRCDLAVRLDDKVCELIEVKAIGLALQQRHLKQVVNYAANQGVEWVILTNAVVWQLHHVMFAKPIASRLITDIDITSLDWRKQEDLERAYPFTKEAFKQGVPAAIRDRQDATSRFLLAALVLNNRDVVSVIRRELRKVVDVFVTPEEVAKVLESEVIKRDVFEGPLAEEAAKRVKQAEKKWRKSGQKEAEAPEENHTPPTTEGSDSSDQTGN